MANRKNSSGEPAVHRLKNPPKRRVIEDDTVLLASMLTRVGRLNEIFISTVVAEIFGSMKHGAVEPWVLLTLLLHGAPFRSSPTDLCRQSLQTSGGMTKTLRNLEDAALITRIHDPNDRRALLVELTPKGQVWARGLTDRVALRYAEIVGAEGEAIYTVLRTVLSRLEGVLDKTRTDDWL